ncbi:ABC transporter permease [Shinella sp. AETb1-6]|uniref:ABC transporter permease n=1 Tax=Shinella sp. AETb1-6 TaxID=2692210 RepID=UPI001367B38D|nr:ABC transporter permease [Shinella sp. AETb1-6]MXN53746.1 ABC transporter permease [Shinella sp. AETb1-6]
MSITASSSPDHTAAATGWPWQTIVIKSGIFVLLAAMMIIFQLNEPAFLRVANIFSILQAVAIVALLGIGVTVSCAIGGFDLSVGALAALSQMAAAYILIVLNGSAFEAIAGTLLIGVLVGLFNGLLIVILRVPDLLATLGTLFLLAGAQLIPTGGRSVAPGMALLDGSAATGSFTEFFLALGRYRVGGVVPVPVIVLGVVALVFWFIMERTRWGRVFYAVGGSPTAAHLAGAPTKTYRFTAYIVSSVLAALGGILLAARLGRGDVSAGNSLMLDAVAACLIGYAVLGANRPNVFGTVVGAVFVGVLLNGLTMLNAPYYIQDFVKGLVLIGALALTFSLSHRRN